MKQLMSFLIGLCVLWGAELSANDLPDQLKNLSVAEPTERDPVTVAALVWPKNASPGDEVTVALKVRIKPGWRIYRYVPASEPYITANWKLEFSDNLQAVGDWEKPAPEAYPENPEIYIYQGEQVFTHKIKVLKAGGGDQTVKATISYQTCNRDICLRPQRKSETMNIVISGN